MKLPRGISGVVSFVTSNLLGQESVSCVITRVAGTAILTQSLNKYDCKLVFDLDLLLRCCRRGLQFR